MVSEYPTSHTGMPQRRAACNRFDLVTRLVPLHLCAMSARDPVLLDATLRPNPPLAPAALQLVLAVVAVINFAFALAFVLRGAWLVMPFMGADVALLAWAFRASLRASRRHEHIWLTSSRLVVERHSMRGPPNAVTLNPYWVRVETPDPPERGGPLTLWSHGRSVRVGSFLGPAERASFASELKTALKRAREGSFA